MTTCTACRLGTRPFEDWSENPDPPGGAGQGAVSWDVQLCAVMPSPSGEEPSTKLVTTASWVREKVGLVPVSLNVLVTVPDQPGRRVPSGRAAIARPPAT